MFDKTNTHLKQPEDFENLFREMASGNKFMADKTVDIKVSPKDYITATCLRDIQLNPMRLVLGDYIMRLHC